MSDYEGYDGIASSDILPKQVVEVKKEKKEVKRKPAAERKQRAPRKKADRKDNIEAVTPTPTPVIAPIPNPTPVSCLPAGIVGLTASTKFKKQRKPSAWNQIIKSHGMPIKGSAAYQQMMQDYEQMKKKYAAGV
jgi:hypothetical protein